VYEIQNRKVKFSVEEGNAHSGNKCAVIENFDNADSKLVQRIETFPNTYYKLSAWVKAQNVPEEQVGANISVIPIPIVSRGLTDTQGKWELLELYGMTGPGQTYIDVACRIGVYGQEDKGKAWFDDFSVFALKSAPFSKHVQQFYSEPVKITEEKTPPNIVQARKQTNADFWIVVFSVLFTLGFLFIYNAFLKKDRLKFENKSKKVLVTLIVFLAFAFVLRLVLGFVLASMEIDVALYKHWGNHLLDVQWPDYYDYFSAYREPRLYSTEINKFFCDYPPVYVMVLGLLAFIKNFFLLGSHMHTILIKSPNIICDIICCILIFRIARRKLNDASALGLSLVYAFNPAIIINSAIWGQADSIYTLLAFLIVETIMNDRMWLGGIILGIALLIKVQTAFVAFALLFALAERKSLIKWFTTIVAGIATFIVLILPFAIKLPPEWIIVQLIGTLTGYPYASVDAYNFFALLGKNWIPSNEPVLFGISADWWGISLGYLFLVFSAFIYFYGKEKSKNYFSGLFTISVIFMFIPGMHERYLYAAIIFSLMAYVYEKDKRFLYLLLGFSLTVFINVYHIFDVFVVGEIAKMPIPDYPDDPLKSPMMLVTSAANLLLFLYMCYVAIDIYILKKVKILKEKIPPAPVEIGDQAAAEAVAETTPRSEVIVVKTEETPVHEATTPIIETSEVTPVLEGAASSTGVEGAGSEVNQEVVQAPPRSKLRNLILSLGLASGLIPFIPAAMWLLGVKELKRFPDDTKVRTGWALGVGIVVILITGIVLAIVCYPGLKGSGFIK
jgi:Gpi18-like mannosyltransferase